MKFFAVALSALTFSMAFASTGCLEAPGKPKPGNEAARPGQVLDAKVLYQQNCAACHGDNGRNGAAISLANPVYLQTAGSETLRRITTDGVKGAMMPAFGKSSGGLLTGEQIDRLTEGMLQEWAKPSLFAGQKPPEYAGSSQGDPIRGKQAFSLFCGRCHGVDADGKTPSEGTRPSAAGTIIDPTYLALISDQGLRSLIIAGRPERGMPDWRNDLQGANARPMTDLEITDVVAWIVSHRIDSPGQPYPNHR